MMEKLIELLNEYEIWKTKDKISQNPKRSRRERYRGQLGSIFGTLMNERESRLSIISKSYGFIKRLVENDKIDTGGKITEDLTYEHFQIPRKYFRGGKYARLSEEMNDIFYHRILALLSIQDNPIDFLISILK